MTLIAKKPCRFAGRDYFIGDEIPAEAVVDPRGMEKIGIIAIANDLGAAPAATEVFGGPVPMNITVHAEEGDMVLSLSEAALQAVVDVLAGTVPDGEAIISGMTEGDALILLDITDSRKAIKAAAKARAMELNGTEEGGAQ